MNKDHNPLIYVLSSANLDATGHCLLLNWQMLLHTEIVSKSVVDALPYIQWPEVSTELLNQLMNVHTGNYPLVKSFCYDQQTIHDKP